MMMRLNLQKKAQEIDPGSEEVAVLLGYTNLALAGVDTFQLASGLLDTGKSSSLIAESASQDHG